MNENIIREIALNLNIQPSQVQAVLKLMEEGGTVPFIARYRKEATGGLDENVIQEIRNVYDYEVNLLKRKEAVVNILRDRGLLTPELEVSLMNCRKLVEVEDIYAPFKEGRKTKATEAEARGLRPLAEWMLTYPKTSVEEEALKYVTGPLDDEKLQVLTVKDAIEGAKYIISQKISDNPTSRKDLRKMLEDYGTVETTLKKNQKVEIAPEKQIIFKMYFEYSKLVKEIKSHNVLAINRGEKEKILSVKLTTDNEEMLKYLKEKEVLRQDSTATIYIEQAVEDAFKRLIYPSIETEVRSQLTEKADAEAINLFGENLHKLLLQPPMKGKIVLGLDPGFRTGCKLSVINEQGQRLAKDKMFLIPPSQVEHSKETVYDLIRRYKVEIVAIGNGTASRESESFIAELIKERHLTCKYVIVSEAGASVYSASDEAQREFPDDSVEERSASSIARRLQDPLSELIKIDPQSIGVGQYQHDVDQKQLGEKLDFIVSQSVNAVGVNLNTASKALLTYVSGLNKTQADKIVKYRDENTKFLTRTDLLKVKGVTEKAYEQAIGFLRIVDSVEPLDATSIHPESYPQARLIMEKAGLKPSMFGKPEARQLIDLLNPTELIHDLGIDRYLLQDIIEAFKAPLRDPRDEFTQPLLRSDILTTKDLKPDMILEGTVRNVVDFGAFIDIGLHDDGLVHISQMSVNHIKHPSAILNVGDIVKVYILDINEQTNKIGLSLLPAEKRPGNRVNEPQGERRPREERPRDERPREQRPAPTPRTIVYPINKLMLGQMITGTVQKIETYGAFIDIQSERNGLLPSRFLSPDRGVRLDINEVLKVGEKIDVFVHDVNIEEQKITLSLFKPDWFLK